MLTVILVWHASGDIQIITLNNNILVFLQTCNGRRTFAFCKQSIFFFSFYRYPIVSPSYLIAFGAWACIDLRPSTTMPPVNLKWRSDCCWISYWKRNTLVNSCQFKIFSLYFYFLVLSDVSRAPISKYFKEVPGTPGYKSETFTVLEGPWACLIWNGSCAELFCFVYDALCPCYCSVLGSVLSDNVSIGCTFSGMLAHYSSNRSIQRPILIAPHVTSSSTLVVGSPANSVDVF